MLRPPRENKKNNDNNNNYERRDDSVLGGMVGYEEGLMWRKVGRGKELCS